MADPKLMEVSDGAVIVGIGGSRDERPLTLMLGIERVGSDDVVGRMFVTLASIEPSDDSPRLDGKPIKEDGRVVSNVIGGSKVPVRLPMSDTPGRRVVKLLIPDGPGRRVVMELRKDAIEVRGFVAIVIVLRTGMSSGPILTARLATKTTVLVPLRWVPADSAPSPLVKVHTPAV